jgi:hypothetical protein
MLFCVNVYIYCGLHDAIGMLARETLTHFDNGPLVRDLLKEIVRLRSGRFFIGHPCLPKN